MLIGHGYRVDLDSKKLSVEWGVVGCGTYKLPGYSSPSIEFLSAGCDCLDRAVDVYFNEWVYV